MKHRAVLMILLVACAIEPRLPQARATSTVIFGTVARVPDGDTIWLKPEIPGASGSGARLIKLRLKGIDAPERCQPWGAQAQEALSDKVLHRRVQWQTSGRDDYGRNLGSVWLAGEDVGAWLVSQGHAWSYRYRSSAGFYDALEDSARQSRRGLFADLEALPPRKFRKLHGPCP